MMAMFASVVIRGCVPVWTAYCSAGQAEGVVAEGVEHVAASHAVVAGEDVGADVAQRVADVEPGPRRVREHVEHVQLRAVGHPVEALGQRTGGVGGVERALALPAVLPRHLELPRQRRGVAVGGHAAIRRRLGLRMLGHAVER